MDAALQNLLIRLTGDGSGYAKMIAEAQASTQVAAQHIGHATERIQGFGFGLRRYALQAMGALSPLVGLLSGVGGAFRAVKLAATEEMNISAFGTLMQNAELGKQMVEDLQKFADTTPLNAGPVQDAAKALLQFGIAGGDIVPTLRMLGDVTGGDNQKLQDMARIFGQVTSMGKMQAYHWRQMMSRGFEPLQIIADKTGKTFGQVREEMRKGGITAKMVQDALVSATSEGGKAFERMEKASKTASGLFSTMQDDIDGVLRVLGAYILEFLHLKEAMQAVSFAAKAVKEWFKSLSPEMKNVVASIAVIVSAFAALALTLPMLAFVGRMSFRSLFSSIDILLGPINALGVVIVGLAALWVNKVGGIGNAWEIVRTQLQDFVAWVQPVLKNVQTFFALVWEGIKQSAVPLWDALAAGARQAFDAIRSGASVVGAFVSANREAILAAAGLSAAVLGVVGAYKLLAAGLIAVNGWLVATGIRQAAVTALGLAWSASVLATRVALAVVVAQVIAWNAVMGLLRFGIVASTGVLATWTAAVFTSQAAVTVYQAVLTAVSGAWMALRGSIALTSAVATVFAVVSGTVTGTIAVMTIAVTAAVGAHAAFQGVLALSRGVVAGWLAVVGFARSVTTAWTAAVAFAQGVWVTWRAALAGATLASASWAVIAGVGKAIVWAWNLAVAASVAVWGALTAVVTGAAFAKGAWTAAVLIAKGATWAFNAALVVTKGLLIGVLIAITAGLAVFYALVPAVAAVAGAAMGVWAAAKSVVATLLDLPTTYGPVRVLMDLFREWGGILKEVFEVAKTDTSGAWELLKAGAQSAFEDIKAVWPPLWLFIQEGFAEVWKIAKASFKMEFDRIWDEIMEGFSWDAVKVKMEKVEWDFSMPFSKEEDAFNKKIQTTSKLVKDAVQTNNEEQIKGSKARIAELVKDFKTERTEGQKAAKAHQDDVRFWQAATAAEREEIAEGSAAKEVRLAYDSAKAQAEAEVKHHKKAQQEKWDAVLVGSVEAIKRMEKYNDMLREGEEIGARAGKGHEAGMKAAAEAAKGLGDAGAKALKLFDPSKPAGGEKTDPNTPILNESGKTLKNIENILKGQAKELPKTPEVPAAPKVPSVPPVSPISSMVKAAFDEWNNLFPPPPNPVRSPLTGSPALDAAARGEFPVVPPLATMATSPALRGLPAEAFAPPALPVWKPPLGTAWEMAAAAARHAREAREQAEGAFVPPAPVVPRELKPASGTAWEMAVKAAKLDREAREQAEGAFVPPPPDVPRELKPATGTAWEMALEAAKKARMVREAEEAEQNPDAPKATSAAPVSNADTLGNTEKLAAILRDMLEIMRGEAKKPGIEIASADLSA